MRFAGFLPPVVQQQLTSPELPEGALPPPRELQAATIFADASGFTSLTERLSRLPDGAERMCEVSNQHAVVLRPVAAPHRTGPRCPPALCVCVRVRACVPLHACHVRARRRHQKRALPRTAQVMNAFLGEEIRIVHEHGGQVIKFAGDALSAIFEVTCT